MNFYGKRKTAQTEKAQVEAQVDRCRCFSKNVKTFIPTKNFRCKMRHASSVNESQAHIKWNSKDKVELLGKPL